MNDRYLELDMFVSFGLASQKLYMVEKEISPIVKRIRATSKKKMKALLHPKWTWLCYLKGKGY